MKIQNFKGLQRIITPKDGGLGFETFPATLMSFMSFGSGSYKLEHTRGFVSLDHGLNVLKDDVDNQSLEFIENRKAMDELLLDLQKNVEKVRERGIYRIHESAKYGLSILCEKEIMIKAIL